MRPWIHYRLFILLQVSCWDWLLINRSRYDRATLAFVVQLIQVQVTTTQGGIVGALAW